MVTGDATTGTVATGAAEALPVAAGGTVEEVPSTYLI